MATFAADCPGKPYSPYESFAEQWRMPTSMLGQQRFWVARAQAKIVAVTTVSLPDQENCDLTIAYVSVPPQYRRRGIGTAMLRATLAEARTERRELIVGQGIRVGGDGEKWAAALGFEKVQEFVLQTLIVNDVDPARWEVPGPRGFRAERWIGVAPTSLVAHYARARTGITDAPAGDSSLDFPEWTVERVREHEAEVRSRNSDLLTVVAVHEATGTVAGLTEMEVRPSRPNFGYQLDTAVLPEFRGNGLGRFLKASMMQWLAVERPGLKQVATNTDSGNTYMIRVNHQVGYVTDITVCDVEASIDALQSGLR